MFHLDPRPLNNLHTAGRAGGRDLGVARCFDLREDLQRADLHRKFIMLGVVAKCTRHAAAACV